MIHITDAIQLDENEIQYRFVRSPGPGGQHVNRAATAVQLRFDLAHSISLPEDIRFRLKKIAQNRINSKGVLTIQANRFRSQDLNRKDALERLIQLIVASCRKTKHRRRTKPTLVSRKKRLDAKKRQSKLKQTRRSIVLTGD